MANSSLSHHSIPNSRLIALAYSMNSFSSERTDCIDQQERTRAFEHQLVLEQVCRLPGCLCVIADGHLCSNCFFHLDGETFHEDKRLFFVSSSHHAEGETN